jgi:hypothetical protein
MRLTGICQCGGRRAILTPVEFYNFRLILNYPAVVGFVPINVGNVQLFLVT